MFLEQKKVVDLLDKYSIFYPKTDIIRDKRELNNLKLNFPVVLKVDSAHVLHKSDFGLVFTNLISYLELNAKIEIAEQILNEKNINDYKFIIQEMIKGTELILGMKTDLTFGKVVVFGIGGVFVEILKDISMRIAPLTKKDCYEMLDEIKGKRLLEGYRKTSAVNKEGIVELMLNFSKLCMQEKEISEIDFNPVIANEKKVFVADARIILRDG